MTYDPWQNLGPEDVLEDPDQENHDDQSERYERGEYEEGC